MERKKVSFWIWLGLIFVLACLLTCLFMVYANAPAAARAELEPKLRQQTLNLSGVAVYLALIFVGHPLAYAALGLGALFGQLFIGSYHYIIPMTLAIALQYLAATLTAGRLHARPWLRCTLTAAIAEGVLVLFCLLYDAIILGVGFGQAMRMFGLHLLSGIVCFLIGVVLLKLFYEHWNGGREQTAIYEFDKKPKRVLK